MLTVLCRWFRAGGAVRPVTQATSPPEAGWHFNQYNRYTISTHLANL
jgi:hypothetical protein